MTCFTSAPSRPPHRSMRSSSELSARPFFEAAPSKRPPSRCTRQSPCRSAAHCGFAPSPTSACISGVVAKPSVCAPIDPCGSPVGGALSRTDKPGAREDGGAPDRRAARSHVGARCRLYPDDRAGTVPREAAPNRTIKRELVTDGTRSAGARGDRRRHRRRDRDCRHTMDRDHVVRRVRPGRSAARTSSSSSATCRGAVSDLHRSSARTWRHCCRRCRAVAPPTGTAPRRSP